MTAKVVNAYVREKIRVRAVSRYTFAIRDSKTDMARAVVIKAAPTATKGVL